MRVEDWREAMERWCAIWFGTRVPHEGTPTPYRRSPKRPIVLGQRQGSLAIGDHLEPWDREREREETDRKKE